jgi:hypothetical protein
MIAWAQVDVEGRLHHGLMRPRVGLVVRHCGEPGHWTITDVNFASGQMGVVGAESSECRTVSIDVGWLAVGNFGRLATVSQH